MKNSTNPQFNFLSTLIFEVSFQLSILHLSELFIFMLPEFVSIVVSCSSHKKYSDFFFIFQIEWTVKNVLHRNKAVACCRWLFICQNEKREKRKARTWKTAQMSVLHCRQKSYVTCWKKSRKLYENGEGENFIRLVL
jgi:hypothetical protein